MSLLSNDAQTRLLFKQFMGVASTALESPFSAENYNFVPNIFSKDVMIEEVPAIPPFSVNTLDGSGAWLDSSSNYGTNTIEESTFAGVGPNNGLTFSEIYPDSNIKFYKRLSLVPVDAGSQGRVWGSFSDYSGAIVPNKNSLLEHTIPFKFDDINSSYLPIVRRNFSSSSTNFQQIYLNSFPVYWLMDSGSGYLLFYSSQGDLEGFNIKDKKDGTGLVQDTDYAPTISCFVYNGKTGITNLDVSGQQQVADLSGVLKDICDNYLSIQDLSGVLKDICDNYLAIQDLSNNNRSTISLDKYFIDIPDAPTDGSGIPVSGESSIVLTWTNPIQKRASLDFYQNINKLYSGIQPSLADDLQDRMNYVPFHRNLKLQFRAVEPSSQTPPPLWPNLPSGTSYPWTDVSNVDISGTFPSIKGPLFKDITYIKFSATPTSQSSQDLFNNKYFNDNGLPTGKIFQFRIAQTNLGYVNGSIPVDNSWNYLYIPDISNQYIELGKFGPPGAPTSLNFINTTYQSADISGMTLNNADVSLNTPFPITYPASTLSVKYQFDLSCSPFNSIQYPTNLNEGQFDVSFVTVNTQENKFTIGLSTNTSSEGTWQGTVNPSSISIGELDVYPEHKYELDGSFCMYNIINGVQEFDPSCTPITDISFVSVRPTRAESNETVADSILYFIGQPSKSLSFADPSANYATIDSTGTTQNNVYFIDNTESLSFTLSGDYYTQDNSDNILGIDASVISCSKYEFDCSNSTLVTDISVNTLGFDSIKLPGISGEYLDTSNNDFKITIFNDDIGTGQKKGGYYSYVKIIPDASTNFIVSQSRYIDSSNNNYDPYDISIKQYYNTQPAGLESWIPSGEKTFQFKLGWKPPPTSFNFTSLTVTNPTTIRDFFGLHRPSSDATVAMRFDINDRNLWWRGSSTDYKTISTTDLFWKKPTLPLASYVIFDNKDTDWSPDANWSVSQTMTETLTISPTGTLGSGSPDANSYCRKGVTTINTPVDQFQIELKYANNVPLPSPQIEYTKGVTQPPTDISFNNKLLFWDFTWKGNTTWLSPLTAKLCGTGVDSTGGFYPDNSGVFFAEYDHVMTLPNNQLMWSGGDAGNGAFRNGNHGNNNENPYIDYSGLYFDNSYNYSSLDISGSGDTVNIVYTTNGLIGGPAGDYYDDYVRATTATATQINGTYKWITVKIIKRKDLDPNKIKVEVFDGSTKMTLGTDYILFICEAGAHFTTTAPPNSPYTGRTGWKDAARTYKNGNSAFTQNSNGGGMYLAPTPGTLDYLQLFTSNNVSADLYVRIGLANIDSTTHVIVPQTVTRKSISSIKWEFS